MVRTVVGTNIDCIERGKKSGKHSQSIFDYFESFIFPIIKLVAQNDSGKIKKSGETYTLDEAIAETSK